MPDLNFTIADARPLPYAAAPHIVFKLQVTNSTGETIHTVIVRCQIQLDVSRRRYVSNEHAPLADLFGEPSRWRETLRSMLWTNTSLIVPAFAESVTTDLQVPCTFDFNVAATKYFAALEDGDVPLSFYFSGTIFYAAADGRLQVTLIPWEKEAAYRMPLSVWRDMMDLYYPNTTWVCLRRDAFERLNAYKIEHGLPTFEEALERMSR